MFNEEEIFFQCPHCGSQISFLVEELYGPQSYIEDCEVCCNPILVAYNIEDGVLIDLDVKKAD